MKRVFLRKFLFVCLLLVFFYASAVAQTEQWTAFATNYAFIKSSRAEKSVLQHGVGLDWRLFSFNKNTVIGFYANVSAAYIITNKTIFSLEEAGKTIPFPAVFAAIIAPVFKFDVGRSAVFYLAPGVRTAVMPEFALGAAVDAGFNIRITDRFFFTAGVIGAVHFIGVDFFQGGNLRRYLSFDVRPYLGFGLSAFKFK